MPEWKWPGSRTAILQLSQLSKMMHSEQKDIALFFKNQTEETKKVRALPYLCIGEGFHEHCSISQI